MNLDKEKEKKQHDFKSLFTEYHRGLCYYAYRFVSDISIAEDLVQDVFFDLWIKRDKIDISYSLKSYLYKATYNKSIDFLRSSRSQEEKWSRNEFSVLSGCFPQDHIPEQEEILHIKEMSQEIQSCIDRLPPQCKKIFRLSREKGLKNKEVAELLNITVKAVEKQIGRALNEIRNHLSKRGFMGLLI